MTVDKLFEPILDNDEKIIETFKPNKTRFIWLPNIVSILFILITCGFSTLIGFSDPTGLKPLLLFDGIILLILGFIIFSSFARYKKTIYCYTNKRFLIRTGFIGADFKALDFDMVGGINVRVDFLDKLVKPNTGSIIFASPASPVIQTSDGRSQVYAFYHIENPYEVYKRIKEFSSKNKDGNWNS